jgi:hypothetical protein
MFLRFDGCFQWSLARRQKVKRWNETYNWCTNPINNYGVNINIGDYVSFSEKNTKEKRILDLDYYVLEG